MIKKWSLLLLGLMLTLSLAACGDISQSERSGSNGSQTTTDDAKDVVEDAKIEENFKKEFNQEIVDNENMKATLISAEKIEDKVFDEERFEVKFEVENKREDTVEVQAREVSSDGKMIDESMLSMSQEIAGGKIADAVLVIQNYDGDLPSLEDNIEMLLHIFSWDDMDFQEDHKVKIDLTK